jgi:hypothetical protein
MMLTKRTRVLWLLQRAERFAVTRINSLSSFRAVRSQKSEPASRNALVRPEPLLKSKRSLESRGEQGQAHLSHSAKLHAAAEQANVLLRDDPEDASVLPIICEGHLRRARAHFNRAEFEAAFSDANAALKADPRNADAKLVRAEAMVALQRWDDAVGAATDSYISAQPFSCEARLSLDLLQLIQKARSVPKDTAAKILGIVRG